ncbi:MAG: class I SAM-dependent methyltransferase [Armatimonadetes bacterium]|nr:class I SAM-dependent methyltransferase [Armatimonadota bacterium]
MDVRDLHEQNRRGWNQGAEAYEADERARLEFLRSGGTNFCPPEFAYLEGLSEWCGRAVHLQCASGQDTLSLWNLGAREVVGVDISDRMVESGRRTAEALSAPATFYRCDVLDTPHELDGTADLVYTGRGALCWIMDIVAWAKVPARLLKPRGRLYIFEGHPYMNVWQLEPSSYVFDPVYGDYFNEKPISDAGWPTTYIGDLGMQAAQHEVKHERQWRIDQIVNACLDAGLVLTKMGEHPEPYWNQFPNIPAEELRRLPQTISLLFTKP